MKGKPIFELDDRVEFDIKENDQVFTLEGFVYTVDANGTFFNPGEPHYDIMVEKSHFSGEKCLYKHISEKGVRPAKTK
jgi:hypothetical protein